MTRKGGWGESGGRHFLVVNSSIFGRPKPTKIRPNVIFDESRQNLVTPSFFSSILGDESDETSDEKLVEKDEKLVKNDETRRK